MPRVCTLTYDRGSLILHPPPTQSRKWLDFAQWDERIEKFRMPAYAYRAVIESLTKDGIPVQDNATGFTSLTLHIKREIQPHPHQSEALSAWKRAGRRGVVVLPTGSGKTILAHLALQDTPRSTLIVVPTLDLMQQWYAGLLASYPDADIGLLGGGSKDDSQILVATYDSAAIHAEKLGNKFALLICDECHHLPSDFSRVIAEFSIAPYRLGLSATPERTDGRHTDLEFLLGAEVYRKTPQELSGGTLSDFKEIKIKVKLSDEEQKEYDALIAERSEFLRQARISLGTLQGWQMFVKASARSKEGRKAMLAHRKAREIAFGTNSKMRILAELLLKHAGERTLIFTDDNNTVYRISQDFLIPTITHQTPVKERHHNLERFRAGDYPALVTSRVLNEGVDVPEAKIAIMLSGSATPREYIQRLGRILRQAEGKEAILYEVIAENTSEERVSRQRKNEDQPTPPKSPKMFDAPAAPMNWEEL